jgi:hypothetical protein
MPLSELRRQPKRPPSASWNLRQRQLEPLEVVWRSLDPRKGCQITLSLSPRLIRYSKAAGHSETGNFAFSPIDGALQVLILEIAPSGLVEPAAKSG